MPYALIIEDDAILDNRVLDFISAFEKTKNGMFLQTDDVEYAKNKKIKLGEFNVFPISKGGSHNRLYYHAKNRSKNG